jgi:hypothetical protein
MSTSTTIDIPFASADALHLHLAVKVVGDSVIGGLDVGDGFMKQEGAFWNMAALNGGQPLLSISASIVMGGVQVVQF